MPASEALNTRHFVQLTRITTRRLQYWREHRLIHPELVHGKPGRYYRWDRQLLFRATLISELMSRGLGVGWVRKRIDGLVQAKEKFLVIEGRGRTDKKSHWHCELFDDALGAIRFCAKSKNSVFMLDLHQLRAGLDENAAMTTTGRHDRKQRRRH